MVVAVVVSSCAPAHGAAPPAQPARATPSTAIVLSPGQPTSIDGTPLTLTFDAVSEDSRCPTGVTCIYAGTVSLTFRLAGGEDPQRSATLRLNGADRETMHSGYRITLVAVTPSPAAGETIEPSVYRATVEVEKQ